MVPNIDHATALLVQTTVTIARFGARQRAISKIVESETSAWTTWVPLVGGVTGAVLGFYGSTWGVTRSLRAQHIARAADLAKEKALKKLDFAVERNVRRRLGLDALMAALLSLNTAVGAFVTDTGNRFQHLNDVESARGACWGALYRVGDTHDDFGNSVRDLLEGKWTSIRNTVGAVPNNPSATEQALTSFRAQLRVIESETANAKYEELELNSNAAWEIAEAAFTPAP